MNSKDEKWALFWCDLLRPLLFDEVEKEQTHLFLLELSQKEVLFPNGRTAKPSLSTLRRKLNRYRTSGFNSLARKERKDRGQARSTTQEIIARAIELKKEQPKRSHQTINRFLKEIYGVTLPRSTLYRHLRQAGATRLKLGIVQKVIRHVDMAAVIASFMQKVTRRVHKDFCDIQLHHRFYRVDQKLRGDSVEVHYDPFAAMDTVELYSLRGQYLGLGTLHHRQIGEPAFPSPPPGKPKHHLLDLLLREHQEQLTANTQGIDYRKVLSRRSWPFYAFAKTFAQLLGRQEGISAPSTSSGQA